MLHPATECEICGFRPKSSAKELKRCGRCGGGLYCSKECQKAAWPTHKAVCSPDAIKPSPSGRRASIESLQMVETLKAWAEMHEDAFSYIVNCSARLLADEEGSHIPFTDPYALVFTVVQVPLPPSGNPAAEFQLERIQLALTEKGEGSVFHDLLKADEMRHLRRKSEDRTYVGVMPVTFKIQDTNLAIQHIFCVHLFCGVVVPLAQNTRDVLHDVQELIIAATRAGYVVMVSPDVTTSEPRVGRMVQGKKGWKWKQIEDWDWKRLRCPLKANLNPKDLWYIHRRL